MGLSEYFLSDPMFVFQSLSLKKMGGRLALSKVFVTHYTGHGEMALRKRPIGFVTCFVRAGVSSLRLCVAGNHVTHAGALAGGQAG